MLTPDLSGRTALVTGSAGGVGAALCETLASRGADVGVHYNRSETAAEQVVTELRETGVESTAVQGDVTDPAAVDGLFDAVERALGRVDILVNNVGTFAPSHWEAIDWERWQRVTESNYYGTVLCSRRALAGMREQRWGRIVNLGYASSDKGLVSPVNFPYFVAKAGVLMFTRMLAADTQDDGVTVNAISPYVLESSEAFPSDAPRGRWGTTDDLAQALLVFCDPDSGYISGQNLDVDGGWLPETV